MIVLIDNFDSFTWNLWHFLNELGATVEVIRNNKLSADEIIEMKPKGIVISPGPCTPKEAGISIDLINKAKKICPILGVCLGHQAIGMAFGVGLYKINPPIHGKLSLIKHNNKGIFDLVPKKEILITRYHSLAINLKILHLELQSYINNNLLITALSEDNVIMGIQHTKYPVYGVQFHPESVLSNYGYRIISSFLNKCGYKKINNKKFKFLENKLIGNIKIIK